MIFFRALKHRDSLLYQIDGMKRERKRLVQQLSQFGWIHPVPSEANFVLCKIDNVRSKDLQNELKRIGAFSRCYATSSGKGALEDFLRFSCGRPQDSDLVISYLSKQAQSSSLAKSFGNVTSLLLEGAKVSAILFDMDGVLADVSKSYRQAIIQSAAHYGFKITNEDIDVEKNRGNANNDWILTQRLLQRAGVAVSLDEVTRVFQSLYEGGLRDTESLMCTVPFLEALSKQFKLAVVTGRPRKEANYFLNLHKIAHFFPVVVCMEDGPAKPDPFPVLRALELLGIEAKSDEVSVFIGDTVDDIVAGLRASPSLIPLGLGRKHEGALFKAGAPRVMGHLHELNDILGLAHSSPIAPRSSGRYSKVSRVTKETNITVEVDLDGEGESTVDSGVGFLNHMLQSLAKHSRMNLKLKCDGDLYIDDHHTVEDCALTLGEAIIQALGDKKGITRFGSAMAPLDESLSRAVVDISGRPYCSVELQLHREKIGDLSSEMVPHFFQSLAVSMKSTIHIDVLRGDNHHHKVEASFKAFALALRTAISKTTFQDIPSTKGSL
jgi:imidazoleglycerol-phosphate dehydratase